MVGLKPRRKYLPKDWLNFIRSLVGYDLRTLKGKLKREKIT
jgi:hypothetical protein